MSTETNKALARHFREGMDKTKGGGFEDYVAADGVSHFPGSPPLNRDQVAALVAMFYTGFPDLHHTIDDQVAEGDKVATRLTFHGTHLGDFQGIPPTGKEVTFSAIVIDKYRDGKMVEHWSMSDTLGLMQQLGVIPQPSAA